MKTLSSLRRATAYVVAVVVLCCAGCSSTQISMGRYDVNVTMSESMADASGMLPSVELHLVALDRVGGRMLQGFSMGDYWNPNRMRDDYVRHVMRFGQGRPKTQMLSRKDPIWSRWDAAAAEYLFVLGDIQGIFEDLEDVKDPRRVILPLHPSRWQTRELQVMIEPGGVFLLTPMLSRPVEE